MRKFTFILYILSIVILGIIGAWIGAYAYKINSIGKLETPILEGMENKNLEYELSLITNESEQIVSPNAVIVIKRNYNECGHQLKEFKQIDNKYVNMDEKEFETEFLKDNEDFIIENFSSKEIVVSEDVNGSCEEHYLVKSDNGFVVVYKYNSNGEKEEYKKTNIAVEYLTETDREELSKGIEIVGKSELNSRLEDYV